MSAVICGLDVQKESTYTTVLDPDGEVLVQRRMKSEDIPGFLEPLRVDRVAVEASTYIIPLYRRLVEEGYSVTVSRVRAPVTRFYHRVAERWGRKAALVAAARKLLTVCYSVLRSQRPYYNPLDAQA